MHLLSLYHINGVYSLIKETDLSQKCSAWKVVQKKFGSENFLGQRKFWVKKNVG